MENNKLKVKDLVNIGIFSALYMAIAMVVMIPVGIAPILWLLWPGIAGLFGGVFLPCCLQKYPKWELLYFSLLLAASCFCYRRVYMGNYRHLCHRRTSC